MADGGDAVAEAGEVCGGLFGGHGGSVVLVDRGSEVIMQTCFLVNFCVCASNDGRRV